ncbi:hypothetical protein FXF51_11485 [Nonomuraea sp. PA05]|uniref:hypothetical protein n=1 Tax=Nonomuraea sp. PA05 TaxID=2604466 RepID=UPI0011D9D9EA|nr:hypothetical protein [Nonomuraea sp. PA05]TYB68460.1 hypothetical protein FXF51_11485 [Nonomuraea sp. PA05]
MAGLLGDKHRFAVEVGDWDGSALRRVDLWVADQWLTCDDNMTFVKQFRHYVERTAVGVRFGEIAAEPFAGLSPAATHRRLLAGVRHGEQEYERFGFFGRWGWGPTTDNVTSFLWRDEDRMVITTEFWRERHLLTHPEHAGTVFAAELPTAEFMAILEETVAALGDGEGVPVT